MADPEQPGAVRTGLFCRRVGLPPAAIAPRGLVTAADRAAWRPYDC